MNNIKGVTILRKTTYKSAIKYDAYKLVKFLVEDKPFVPFKLKEKM